MLHFEALEKVRANGLSELWKKKHHTSPGKLSFGMFKLNIMAKLLHVKIQ